MYPELFSVFTADQIKNIRSFEDRIEFFFHSQTKNEYDQRINDMAKELGELSDISQQFLKLELKLDNEDRELNGNW